jgi:hypothetical protein
MKLSRSALGKTTVGQVLNIMSNDAHRIEDVRIDKVLNYFKRKYKFKN